MKITKITVQWDTGAETTHADPKGLDLGDIPGMVGLSSNSIANAESDTLQGFVATALTGALGLLMKKWGLSI